MAMEYFCCYHSYEKSLRNLSDQEVGRLFRSLLVYSMTAEKPELTGRESIAFDFIAADMDRAKEKYHALCASQSEKAKKRWDADACNCMPTHAEHAKEKAKAKAKEKEKGQEKDNPNGLSKKRYGEFMNVELLDAEHAKLVDSLGDRGVTAYIERLSAYIAQSGKKYKSHYATILNWWRRDGEPIDRSSVPTVMKPDTIRIITPDMTAEEIF